METEISGNELPNNKLVLVLDLDNTLVHRTKSNAEGDKNPKYVYNLRPQAQEFVKNASSLFNIYISTFASLPHAHRVAKILDPDHVYINTIFWRDNCIRGSESQGIRRRKCLDLIPHDVRHVIIVDDDKDVWFPDGRDNLIHVPKYFSGQPDHALKDVLQVLKSAHSTFFEKNHEDVRVVLKKMRRATLKGSRLLCNPLPTIGYGLGSIICNRPDSAVTHVVQSSADTEFARWALREGKFLVSPQWLETAYYSWRHPNEQDFQITQDPSTSTDQQPKSTASSLSEKVKNLSLEDLKTASIY